MIKEYLRRLEHIDNWAFDWWITIKDTTFIKKLIDTHHGWPLFYLELNAEHTKVRKIDLTGFTNNEKEKN